MGPTPEDSRPPEPTSSTGLQPNVAGLLCYLGAWVTGIIFLIVEQKDRTVRFHAAQSIIVFGALNVLWAIFHPLPVVGWAFGILIGVTALVLWVFLMVRAFQGERYKLPVAGNLAEPLSGVLMSRPAQPEAAPPAPSQPPSVPPIPVVDDRVRRSGAARTGRIVGSSFAIAASIAALIFFNFFSRYIAYYFVEHRGAADVWVRVPVLTSAYGEWLAVLNTTLILTILAHIVFIAYDRYIVRETGLIILSILGVATAVSMLTIYPFDFAAVPDRAVADGLDIGVKATLGIVIFLIAVTTLVSFIRLIINLLRGTASYP